MRANEASCVGRVRAHSYRRKPDGCQIDALCSTTQAYYLFVLENRFDERRIPQHLSSSLKQHNSSPTGVSDPKLEKQTLGRSVAFSSCLPP